MPSLVPPPGASAILTVWAAVAFDPGVTPQHLQPGWLGQIKITARTPSEPARWHALVLVREDLTAAGLREAWQQAGLLLAQLAVLDDPLTAGWQPTISTADDAWHHQLVSPGATP